MNFSKSALLIIMGVLILTACGREDESSSSGITDMYDEVNYTQSGRAIIAAAVAGTQACGAYCRAASSCVSECPVCVRGVLSIWGRCRARTVTPVAPRPVTPVY